MIVQSGKYFPGGVEVGRSRNDLNMTSEGGREGEKNVEENNKSALQRATVVA